MAHRADQREVSLPRAFARSIRSARKPIAVATPRAFDDSTASICASNSASERTCVVKKLGLTGGSTAKRRRRPSTNSTCPAGSAARKPSMRASFGTFDGSIKSMPYGMVPIRSSTCARISGISCGISRASPGTGKPPARAIATATSTECEKPKIGWRMPSCAQIGVRIEAITAARCRPA